MLPFRPLTSPPWTSVPTKLLLPEMSMAPKASMSLAPEELVLPATMVSVSSAVTL